ncbi:LysR family transcriptional regulator [Herbaspirillum sp. alder98]|uniref:LysR family transcriptional regulator n=1 Tax=Herbaspirillum sp. alder98 TaxID=2913096 RepID=UPI001CD83E8D|nr:LysR family transcriptional regulator [Herbaspirillum sp. alder98]MCA1326379.1 LysR family transcriptional regulator [Herbaspirillum sp. alder98]
MELLNDMALFIEVASVMSFRKAADATGVPNSTLSRRISALEKAIGLRLLHRTTRKVELTEAGRLYYDRCRRIVDEARIAHEQLGEMLAQPSGLLRASFPVDFATVYLAPLIAEFSRRYPGISFDFDLTPRRVDLVTEPFDVAIRMGELPNSALIARQLARLSVQVYASPRYLDISGEPATPADLSKHECLGFSKSGKWSLHRAGENIDVEVGGRFQINSVGMARRLATLDLGVIMLPREIVQEDVAAGRLRQILPQWAGNPTPVYALTETRLLPAKTQRFIEFLQEHLNEKSLAKGSRKTDTSRPE